MKIKYIVIALLVLVFGYLIWQRIAANKEKNAAPAPAGKGKNAAMAVYGTVIFAESFADNLNLTGTIEPDEQVEIRSEVSGLIDQLNFSEGSRVNKGAVLVKIVAADLLAQLDQAKTRTQLTSENERRAKLLLQKEAISQEEYDIASADYRTAKSQISFIEAQLSKTYIRAPFSGTIGLRSVSKGAYITPTSPIAKLVKSDRVKLSFAIPEKYVNRVSVGQRISFKIPESKETFEAKIFAIDPAVDLTTRTLLIKAMADNTHNKFVPGVFVNVILPLESIDDALMVPSEALIPIQNGKKVFIVKEGNAREVIVETGGRTKDKVNVLSGLTNGDTVLTTGVMSLKNDVKVKVTLR
ncbi:efflux RND transporter periplasmic adaptor subunit [Sphingobacterium faecium]|jgi:membrane fusion protein (multidrug efflux system)|uniref:efflux RND transporter periplasmic adaptor subunit n=1 Tax=Sphingobacterium faecium TaxID=34087 RepID=UPI00129166ED|nr:efflux RND transporter periplasmic adaptor subunit [Sphingobacterium faecium]MQP29083.1 efflux RND transporter periplasmic adaptor subunit [Sphingobacterium faecium]